MSVTISRHYLYYRHRPKVINTLDTVVSKQRCYAPAWLKMAGD